MKNKNLLIGGAVVVGGLLFFYFRNKSTTDNGEERSIGGGSGSGSGTGGSGAGTGAGTGTGGSGSGSGTTTTTTTGAGAGAGTTTPPKGTTTANLTPFEVNKRLLGRCGVRPPSFLKNQVNNYDVCKDTFKAELRSQGLIPFNGLSEDNSSRLDFDGNIVD
jgi:hypothetical protein